MGMAEGEPFSFDLMIRDALIAAVKAGESWIPFYFRQFEFLRNLVIEFFAGRMFVVRDVEDPLQMVPQRIVDRPCAVGFMDHVRIVLAAAGKGVTFELFDPFGKFPARAVDLGETESADMPSEFFQGKVVLLGVDQDFSLV